MNRVSKSAVDWFKISKKIGPDMGAAFKEVKSRQDNIVMKISTLPPEKPEIDWNQYKKYIHIPGLLDKLKKEYESYKVPEPKDISNWHEILMKDEEKLMKEIEESKLIDDKIIAASENLLRVVKTSLPKPNEMTYEIRHVFYPQYSVHEAPYSDGPNIRLTEETVTREEERKDKPFFDY